MLQRTINILDFISPSEKVDVGADIQKVLDFLKNSSGGTLFFPARTYCISKTIFFYSNQNLIFEEGAILKRISTPDSYNGVNLTCGCFLCNWFEEEDTKNNTIACENVLISGATFDMGSLNELKNDTKLQTGVAPINTCHAKNVRIQNCEFKNNYTAHCIEVNSSEDVYIEGCSFKNYLGRVDISNTTSNQNSDKNYNEMIQIDKAVNAALGTGYYSSLPQNSQEQTTANGIIGYGNMQTKIARTMSSTDMPDFKPCTNINIYNCTFETNSRCVAIGNHHEIAKKDTVGKTYNTTTHSNINIYNNLFEGETAERGHIAFDNFTTNIDIYNNTFISGTRAIKVLKSGASCSFYNNRIDNISNSYKNGNIYSYGNIINGEMEGGINNNDTNNNGTNKTNVSCEGSYFLEGFVINSDNFGWILRGEKDTDEEGEPVLIPKEYDNQDIFQFESLSLQSLQMCFYNKIDISDGDWYEVGYFKEGCQLPGHSPFIFPIINNLGKTVIGCVVPKEYQDGTVRNFLRISDPAKTSTAGKYFYISQILPCDKNIDNITEVDDGFILNTEQFEYDSTYTDEYYNSKVHSLKNCEMQYFQLCLNTKTTIDSGSWVKVGDFSNDCTMWGGTAYGFYAKSENGVTVYCMIIPEDAEADALAPYVGTLRLSPRDGDLEADDVLYICSCVDTWKSTKKEKSITLSENFQWRNDGQYSNSTILETYSDKIQKINLMVETKKNLTKNKWYVIGTIDEANILPGTSPYSTIGFFGNGVAANVVIVPKFHYNRAVRYQIRVKPYGDVTYTSTVNHEYKNRLTVCFLIPLLKNNKTIIQEVETPSTDEDDSSESGAITSTSADAITFNSTNFNPGLHGTQYAKTKVTKFSSGVMFISFSGTLKTNTGSEVVIASFNDENYYLPGASLYTSIGIGTSSKVPYKLTIVPENYAQNGSVRNTIRIQPFGTLTTNDQICFSAILPAKI